MNGPDTARRAHLDFLARCDQAFQPYAPIELPEFFAGRDQHIERLRGEVGAPGRQVAIFGERGVGKTSLARLSPFFLQRDDENTHFVRCEHTSTFDTIFTDVLAGAGFRVVLNGVESESGREGGFAIGPLTIGGGRRVRQHYRDLSAGRQITSRLLLDTFADIEGLIIIDEYDRVSDPSTHTRLAELLKHFSDARSRSKIMVVGVGDTVSQLVGEHESLGRSLAQIKLDRMSEQELLGILERGEAHLGVNFKSSIKQRIVRLADGFPYFVHLIARHASRAGARQVEGEHTSVVIADVEYAHGLGEALVNAAHSLAEHYASAVITTRRPSEKFTFVLWAMALAESREVQVKDIAKNMAFFGGEEPKPGSFNWNLGELASDKRKNVLVKVREGYYKFADPLMRPYIRTMMEHENIIYQGKQWEFPFMRGAS